MFTKIKRIRSNMLVVFLGPDGSGKSTIIERLYNLDKNKYTSIYLGHQDDYRIKKRRLITFNSYIERVFFQKYSNSTLRGRAVRLISIMLRYFNALKSLIDFIAQHEDRIVLIDRYPYDYFLREPNINGGKFQQILFYYLFPRPELVVLLEGDPILINKRKAELTPIEITSAIARYKSFILERNIPAIFLNTTDNTDSFRDLHEKLIKA